MLNEDSKRIIFDQHSGITEMIGEMSEVAAVNRIAWHNLTDQQTLLFHKINLVDQIVSSLRKDRRLLEHLVQLSDKDGITSFRAALKLLKAGRIDRDELAGRLKALK